MTQNANRTASAPVDWYLPMDETLDEARVRAILARFGPEVKRLGQDLAERVRADLPGLAVEGKVFGVPALLAAYKSPRAEQPTGITLGMVSYAPSGGGLTVVPILLDWESGAIYVRE